MRAVDPAVNISRLFAIFVALAVLIAPAVSRASAVLSGVPDHQLMMEQTGHCQMPGGAGHDKGAGKSCCIAMCTAVAVHCPSPSGEEFAEPVPPVFTITTLHIPYLAEIATPPPRRLSSFRR